MKTISEAGLIAVTHRSYRQPLHRYAGRTSAALGQWDVATATFGEILGRVRAGRLGYGAIVEREARYYLGMAGMQENAPDSALVHFYRCDELSRTLDAEKATGFMTLANLRIGMCFDLQGKRDLALKQYDKVLGMKDHQSAHDQARQFKKSPHSKSYSRDLRADFRADRAAAEIFGGVLVSFRKEATEDPEYLASAPGSSWPSRSSSFPEPHPARRDRLLDFAGY